MLDDHRSVCHVDVHQGTGSIERAARFGEGDAVLLRNHGDSSLPPAVGSVKLFDGLGSLFEIGRFVETVPKFADVAENQILPNMCPVKDLGRTLDDAGL